MSLKTLQNIAIAGAFCWMGWLGLRDIPQVEASQQPSVTLKTQPPLIEVVPFKQPVKITLAAKDIEGVALKNAQFRLKLLTPSTNPWFTTNFPMVEGTQLFNLETISMDGTLALEQVFPIRGSYQLGIEIKPQTSKEFKPIARSMTLSVPENPEKYHNLSILALILISIGWAGGWVIGDRQPVQPGELVPRRVRLLLSTGIIMAIATLLAVNVSAELAEFHHHEHESHSDPGQEPSEVESQGLKLKLSGSHDTTVGELAPFSVTAVKAKTTKPETDVRFQVTTTQLEDNQRTFAFEGTPSSTGQQTWQQQFFDGAPHRVQVEIFPKSGSSRQFRPFKVSQVVNVAGVAPPIQTRLISLSYFVGLISLGLVTGLGQQNLKKKGRKKIAEQI